MDISKTLSIILMMTLSVSCGLQGNKEGKTQDTVAAPDNAGGNVDRFPYPDIPLMLSSPDERKAYLLRHYWDEFDFADTTLVNNRELIWKAFVNCISMLADETISTELVRDGIDNFCSAMEKHEHARMVCMRMVDDLLYDVNLPFYNERLYAVYLERMLESDRLDNARKGALKFRLDLMRRNSPGSIAADFRYRMPDGRSRTLLGTPVSGNRLLLVFFDPECHSCKDIMMQMIEDRDLSMAVAEGKLTVMAVYTEGNEEVWKRTCSSMPEGWIVGNDGMSINDGALYDLKAMPSLYLLDKGKKVILKDAPYAEVRRNLGF